MNVLVSCFYKTVNSFVVFAISDSNVYSSFLDTFLTLYLAYLWLMWMCLAKHTGDTNFSVCSTLCQLCRILLAYLKSQYWSWKIVFLAGQKLLVICPEIKKMALNVLTMQPLLFLCLRQTRMFIIQKLMYFTTCVGVHVI